MTKHNITTAENVYRGKAFHANFHSDINKPQRGLPINSPIYYSYGALLASDTDGIALSQTLVGAGAMAIDGVSATGGVSTLSQPRLVKITSTGDDSGVVFTVTGTDVTGAPVVEDITGANAGGATGGKAFKTVTSIVADGATASTVKVGWGGNIGLPYHIDDKCAVLVMFDGQVDAATVTVGDTSVATATTNDVFGTFYIAGTADGTKTCSIWIMPKGNQTKEDAFGVKQYAG